MALDISYTGSGKKYLLVGDWYYGSVVDRWIYTEINIKQSVIGEKKSDLPRQEQRNIIDILDMLVLQAKQR